MMEGGVEMGCGTVRGRNGRQGGHGSFYRGLPTVLASTYSIESGQV
jgi:hypothetical protein